METIEVRFQNILVGLHGYFVYTRRAEGEVELYDQYRAEALNPRFPREGTLIGQHFRMERGLTLSEVQSKRQDGYAIVAEGQDLLPIWVRIIDSVNRLNESPFVYRAFSNNSNAFINIALWRAGLPKVKPYKGFDENGYAPGFDVLLDLRSLRKGEADEKPEDRQLRIPDNRETIRGNPSKHRHQPNTNDDRGAIDPAPDEPSVATVEAESVRTATSALPPSLSRMQSSTIQLGAATLKQQSLPSGRPRKWPYDGNPFRVRVVWKPGQSTLVAAQRARRQVKDAAAVENVQLKLETERWILSKIEQGIARGKGKGIWFDHDFWFKVVYPGETGY